MPKSPNRSPVTPKKKVDAPNIKRDLIKEYQAKLRQTDGKNTIIEVLTLADDDCLANVKLHISTQSLELDRLLNGKGIPTGRVTELYGPPHIGKSTIMDHLFAQVQKMGGVGILLDTEGARDSRYTQSIGVDLEKLQYIEFAREALHIENVIMKIYETVEFWRDNAPDTPVVIGWDALGGTATRDELEKRLEKESRTAQAATVLRKACRQLPPKLGNTKIAVVICNHEYQTIQLGAHGKAGKETYGGAAVKHLASIRIQLHSVKDGWIKKSDGEILGRKIGVNLIKNRLGHPFGSAEIALLSGVGIDNTWAIFERLKAAGIIVISGAWAAINLDGEVIKFQGWTGLAKLCAENDTLFPRLVSVYQSLG